MNTDDIGYFLAVAGSQNLSAAARQLGISQPTLTKSVARLERALGMQLFERKARGVVLTESGQIFAAHARDIHARIEDASIAMRDLRSGRAGLVRIGVGIGIPQMLLADAVRPLMRQGMMIEMLGGTPAIFGRLLLNSEIDFAVAGSGFANDGDLMWKPLFRDPRVVAAPVNHPLHDRAGVSWPDLATQTWLVPATGTEARGWLEHQFGSRGLMFPSAMVALRDHPFPLRLGVTFNALALLERSRLGPSELGHAYREVAMTSSDDLFDRSAGLVWRAKGYLSPTALRLMKQIESAARVIAGAGGTVDHRAPRRRSTAPRARRTTEETR
ncbi:LysR family transcriptional regulator [Roseomonas terrae]|uniref:LysR family transcriptional regulator n=1 Tax=Neoroseomonas terrae TaxID=424799 RepID=A0ABS5ELV9_9PROT|nr:LysR family transcriptional regulator [Neoroseomonas terrae]MBR0652020.1 LysR family transcriptional regulator [Neoroseomonas terrae]